MKALVLAAGMAMTAGAADADVHLGKPLAGADPLRWRGMALGAVVDPAQVERIILLRAVTSAPRELDLANLRRILAASAPLRLEAPDAPPPPPWQPRQGIWHALLLMRSGQVFELELHAGDAGLRGCLAAEDGARGCFVLPQQAVDAP
ncbi:hypothetical protein [Luteimonas sp. SDU82]|uniref:hypothetical protein n=1 Tax=Luteimonas sp. SDU82 TaxID=3422592 RepID=UPI003EBB7C98